MQERRDAGKEGCKIDLRHSTLTHCLCIRECSLARINFIKSRLVYESFSDLSKDVDLVSQEILLLDTRFTDCPANKEQIKLGSVTLTNDTLQCSLFLCCGLFLTFRVPL